MVFGRVQRHLRCSETTHSPKLRTLDALGLARIAFDLFLATCGTRNRQTFSWSTGFGHPPLGIDRLSVDDFLAD